MNALKGRGYSHISQFLRDVEDSADETDRGRRLKGVVRLLAKIALDECRRGRISESDALDILTLTFPVNDRNYDQSKGKYNTYMGKCLRLHLRDPRYRRAGAHIPDSAWVAYFALEKARLRHIEEHCCHPTFDDLAKATGMSRRRVDVLMGARHIAFPGSSGDAPIHVSLPVQDDGDSDALTDGWHPAVHATEIREVPSVDQMTNWLPSQQRAVIRMRFVEGKTLDEIGKVYGVCGERIRHIAKQALCVLREKIDPSLEDMVR